MASDPSFGAGHLARSLALAKALGSPPAMIFADPHGIDRIGPDTAELHVVEEASFERADAAVQALRSREIDGLIIDSYAIGEDVVAEAAAVGFTAAFRDELPYGREGVSIDLNPKATASHRVIAGPRFVPLGARYEPIRDQLAYPVRSPVATPVVLISFGAWDRTNRTQLAIDACSSILASASLVVALASEAPNFAAVQLQVRALDGCRLVADCKDMAGLYLDATLAVGAPGMSQFERACCGLPTVLVCQNDRQQAMADGWVDADAARLASGEAGDIGAQVAAVLADEDLLSAMRARALSLVDGKGARRLAEELQNCAAS